MPEEINHARRFLFSTFLAGSAITIAAADLGIIGPADAILQGRPGRCDPDSAADSNPKKGAPNGTPDFVSHDAD
jgi:hypothetical protein